MRSVRVVDTDEHEKVFLLGELYGVLLVLVRVLACCIGQHHSFLLSTPGSLEWSFGRRNINKTHSECLPWPQELPLRHRELPDELGESCCHLTTSVFCGASSVEISDADDTAERLRRITCYTSVPVERLRGEIIGIRTIKQQRGYFSRCVVEMHGTIPMASIRTHL